MMKLNHILLLVFTVGLVFLSCKKDDEIPVNPYDSIDYTTDTSSVDTLDKNSIAAIHKDILQTKCAAPGCHDGNFEPDFRTVFSSYSTLVYHPIIKNNSSNSFKYRVVPNNSSESVLYERITNCCFVNTNDRMPQSNIGQSLPADDIARIKAWIDNGAKDLNGETAVEPNKEPVFQYVYAIIDEGFPLVYNTKELSKTDNRQGNIAFGSMILDTNMNVMLTTEVDDDKTERANLKNGHLSFSYDKNDFSNPFLKVDSKFLDVNGGIWYNTFSTIGMIQDTVIYMRYYINDGDRTDDTEFPEDITQDYFKSHWSFVVEAGSN